MGNKITVFIIDDKEKLCRILAKDFEQAGCGARFALNPRQALEELQVFPPDVILLDLRLGNENGLDLLKILQNRYPLIPVIMITGHGSIENAVEAVKIGAYDYIQKPATFTKIHRAVTNAAGHNRLKKENADLRQELTNNRNPLLTRTQVMQELLFRLSRLAERDIPILITGESGTGKELVADFIHQSSIRRDRKLFKVNCAALPENLLDNELFGHEKGAYTGANESFMGIFERSHGGTLFLDELGDMSLEIQAKILRTLQNSEVRRLGGEKTIKIDVRFIAATNKDLPSMVSRRDFREDLYYRLNLAMINIPPLRERREDIPLLIDHFLQELAQSWGVPLRHLSTPVAEILQNYHWPGNIRELKNVIHYMTAIAGEDTIGLQDIPPRILPQPAKVSPPSAANPREEMEEKLIRDTLKNCRYNKKQTADMLKMSRKTLYNKLHKYGIT